MVTFANVPFLYIQQASRSNAAGNANFQPASKDNQLKLEAGQSDLEHNICGLFPCMNIPTIASEYSRSD